MQSCPLLEFPSHIPEQNELGLESLVIHFSAVLRED